MRRITKGVAAAALAAAVFLAFFTQRVAIPLIQSVYEEEPVEMVVLMYHSVNSNPRRAGTFVITPAALRSDLEYIKAEGYTTVLMADIIGYVMDGTPLPDKPILLTFDDGFYNNYLNVFPLLQEYDAKAVISAICSEVDKFSAIDEKSEKYSSLTWDMMKTMMDSGLVEFQNHSYGLHTSGGSRHGLAKKSGESSQQYRRIIEADVQKAQDRHREMLGWTPTTFTYPYGVLNREGDEVLRELGICATLDSKGKIYTLSREESCLWRIPRFNRPAGTSARTIIERAFSQSNADTGR